MGDLGVSLFQQVAGMLVADAIGPGFRFHEVTIVATVTTAAATAATAAAAAAAAAATATAAAATPTTASAVPTPPAGPRTKGGSTAAPRHRPAGDARVDLAGPGRKGAADHLSSTAQTAASNERQPAGSRLLDS